jgi:hypothetical protein
MLRSVAVLVCLAAAPGLAQDAFEIQVYNADTAAPGQVGAELHVNHVFVGRTTFDGTERPTDHVTHLTIEPHIGIADWCEAGAYLSTAVRGDGTFDYAGIKVRFKARLPQKLFGVLGLSLNQELSATRADYEAGEFAWEIRPIIDLDWRRLYLAVNPIVSVPLGGALKGHPAFEPGVKAAVRVLPFMQVGAEYYGALGPFAPAEPASAHVHRLFGALDFDWKSGRQLYEVNVGVGYGLTGNEKWLAKLVVAVDWEPVPTPAPPP